MEDIESYFAKLWSAHASSRRLFLVIGGRFLGVIKSEVQVAHVS
jgi:hypothetical protein